MKVYFKMINKKKPMVKNKYKIIAITILIMSLLYSCTQQQKNAASDEYEYRTVLSDLSLLEKGEPSIAVYDDAPTLQITRPDELIKEPNGYDLRSRDASALELGTIEDYNDISFNNNTIWPDKLPDGFDPDRILEMNKQPGLGIKALHDEGITGAGVGIAIIDQALLSNHQEYSDNLMLYEYNHYLGEHASMHGTALASIAVGKNLGVAPESKLYYIASVYGYYTEDGFEFDASIIGDCILRILEINEHLPENNKIRVIAIAKGYDKESQGYSQLTQAIQKADRQGVFVLTTTPQEYYGFYLSAVGRKYLDNPDEFSSYRPAKWYEDMFYTKPAFFDNFCFVPTGSRTIASFTGPTDYQISCEGGMSWGVPWFAGLYALGCQVKPSLTPTEFFTAVKESASTISFEHNGQSYELKNIVNPVSTIEFLKENSGS